MKAQQARSSILALAAALLAGPLSAQGTLEVIGSRSLQVPPVKSAQRTTDFSIPVRWTGPANARILLPVLEVNLGGEPREISALRFLLRPDPITRRPTLLARIDLAKAATTGTYTVKVQPPSPPAAAQPPAPLELSFTRPAAEVRIDTPVRLERVIYLPWVSTIRPRSLVLTESSSRSPVRLADLTWKSDLRGADGKPSKGRLRFRLPAAIEAWQQGTATVDFLDLPALGRSSGTLTLRSEQLAARSVDFPLEVTSRVSLLWLLLTLLGSIVLGYLTRTRIEERRKRIDASLAIERQRGLLYDLLGVAVDEGLKAELMRILNTLATAEKAAGPEVQAILDAAARAKTETEAALAKSDQDRAALRTRIAGWKLALVPAEAQAASVGDAVRAVLRKLSAQEKALTEGYIGRVAEFFAEDAEKREVAGLRDALEDWLGRLESALHRPVNWHGTLFAATAGEIPGKIQDLRTGLATADTVEKLGAVLAASAALAGRVRNGLLKGGVESVLNLASDAVNDLMDLKDETLKEFLDRVTSASRQLKEARDRSSANDLTAVAEAMRDLGEALAEALVAAYLPTRMKEEPAEPAGLSEGKFEAVLREVVARRRAAQEETEERPLGRLQPFGPERLGPASRAVPLSVEGPDAVRRPVWTAALKVPERPTVGREAALSLVVRSPREQPVPVVTVRWSIGDGSQQQGVPGDLYWSFTPRQPGPVVIRAEAVAADGQTAVAEARLLVLPAEGYEAILELTEQRRRDERIQSIVSGILITAAGYAMFSGAFIGVFQDFLTAAFWGYTVDLGVARVREMAAPLLTRQPFSAPQ